MKRILVLNGASLDLVERIKHGGSGACSSQSGSSPFFAHTSCLISLQRRMKAERHTHTHFAPRRNYMLLFNLSCQGERARALAFIALFVPATCAPWVNLLQVHAYIYIFYTRIFVKFFAPGEDATAACASL
jgi:hypothetical protein